MSHLFPGRKISIDSRCLHSGDHVHVLMRDSDVLELSPKESVGYSVTPLEKWGHPSWAYT